MITVQIKLVPTIEQEKLLVLTLKEYIASINDLVDYCIGQASFPRLSSASFSANLPSCVRSEVCLTVKSIFKKFARGVGKSMPVLKKPVATWNNQNYKIFDNHIEFPMIIDGKSKRVVVKALIPDSLLEKLRSTKLGTLRITQKSNKWIAQIAVSTETQAEVQKLGGIMGVDLGLKIPAVVVTETGKTKFVGNGRQNKFMRRKFKAKRKKLGKAKKVSAINKLNNKEQRWMSDKDHKISREIVKFAVANRSGTIRLEKLTNIRQTARTSRKNAKNLHMWSFYRLATYIEYKAKMVGITVEFVDPKYTSQNCPKCGKRNHANDRRYSCSCGYTSHRDRVGAINIISAPVVHGNSVSA